MSKKKIRILIIAYFFDPYIGVGAKRISYWAKHLSKISKNNVEVTVITAIKQDLNTCIGIDNLIYVQDNKKSFWSKIFKNDNGLTWVNDLKVFFRKYEFKHDVVLLTGGPFLHFGIGKLLKKTYGCKIILDYRDPFAINPLFKNQHFFKREVKKYIERKHLKHADRVITVNKYCANLLSTRKGFKTDIIDNGFDEKVLNEIRDKSSKLNNNKINIVYAGKLSHGRIIDNFLEYVEKNNQILFHYIGEDFQIIKNSKNTINYGVKSYKQTLCIIGKCDIGLVLTGGNLFESTTKIFDYIGLKKKVLVVSEKKLLKGSIVDILTKYSNYIICNNSLRDFDKIFTVSLETEKEIDNSVFSRENGIFKFEKILNELI